MSHVKPQEQEKKKSGRPIGYSPAKTSPKIGMTATIEGDEVVIRLPKKDLSRKRLAEII